MKLLDRIRNYAYLRALRKRLQKSPQRSIKRLEQAKSVGILFPAENLAERKVVITYAERLRKQGKKVHLLGFIPTVDAQATFDFDHFTKKDIHWLGRYPQGKQIDLFLDRKLDAFVCLSAKTDGIGSFIALSISAPLKIGPYSAAPYAFDLMIDAKDTLKTGDFIKQYEGIFALATKQKQREPALV